jgi:hypothetical protein
VILPRQVAVPLLERDNRPSQVRHHLPIAHRT